MGVFALLVVWGLLLLHMVETTTNDYFCTSLQLAVAILQLSPNVRAGECNGAGCRRLRAGLALVGALCPTPRTHVTPTPSHPTPLPSHLPHPSIPSLPPDTHRWRA